MRENQTVQKTFSPESETSDKTDSSKKEENNVPLADIVENLTSYLKKFSHFKKYEKDIKNKYKKYNETNTAMPDRWPVKFIKRAWSKTETMYTFSGRRKCWSLAILLEVMKRSQGYDESEREEAQSNVDKSEREEAQSDGKEDNQQSKGDPSADKPVYIRIPFSEMSDKEIVEKDKKNKDSNTAETDKKNKASNTVETDKKNKDSNTVEKDKKNKDSNTVEKDKKNKASNTAETESTKKKKTYKLIDKVPSPTQILQKSSYITLYDNQTRNAAWVYEILNKSPKDNDKLKKTRGRFKLDPSVHPLFQPSKDTYKYTEYDRGHLAAVANHRWCQEAFEDTYFISNVVPQQSNFNSGLWKSLEKRCRQIAQKEEVRNVHVYTGPLYLSRESNDNNDQNKSKEHVENKNKGRKADMNNLNKKEKHVEYEIKGGKAVPTHLFKVIIVENTDGEVLEPECYKMANENPESKVKDYKDSESTEKQTELTRIDWQTKSTKRTLKQTEMTEMTTEESENFKRKRLLQGERLKKDDLQGEQLKKDILQESKEDFKKNLEQYKVTIDEIQKDSGLIFVEGEIKEEIEDGTWKVHRRKNSAEPEKRTWIEVRVSGSYTDHSDRALLH